MTKSRMSAVLSAFIPLLICGSVSWAADNNADPNAAIRKSLNPPGSSVLADLERVQRTNNQLAVDHFTKLIKKDPKDALSYSRRGKAYAGLKNYDLAMADYDKAIQLDEKLAEAYVHRAVARYVQEDYDGSWKDVHQAQALGGEFWPAFMDALKASSGRTE
jgi:tetratricopeptide (TPR) repeat protein